MKALGSFRRRMARTLGSAGLVLFAATGCGGTEGGSVATETDSGTNAQDVAVDAADASGADVTPRGLVYLHDPETDQGQTTEVTLVAPTDPGGMLLGPYADVKNCLNELGGEEIRQSGQKVGAFCKEVHTAKRGADGTWLHVKPPTDASDPNDAFAEVQMYHHVHEAHGYFKGRFGLTDLDYPLDALVNVNLYIEPDIAVLIGATPGWQGYPNAAFVPKEGFAAFKLPPREAGAIIFGQYGSTDLSYDASVIYHEYTHAMIGTTRLASLLPDVYGLDHMPGAMNEGFADYFAATMTNHPVIGAYGIAFAGPHMVRDLSVIRRCPDDLTGESHADGRVLSSALWRIRAQVGADRADGVILRALQAFTKATNMTAAAKLMVSEAEAEDANMAATFAKILKEHGVDGCERIKEWKAWKVEDTPDKVAYTMMGKQEFGGNAAFPDGVPGHLQFYVSLPSTTKAVTLRWQAEAHGFFSQPATAIAVNPAQPPTVNFVDTSISARAVLPMSPDPDSIEWQSLTLAGKCIGGHGGKLFVLPLNQGQNSARVTRMEVVVHKSMPSGPNLRSCE